MAMKVNRKQTSYGYPSPQAGLFPDPFVAERDPSTTDFGEIGQVWVNESSNAAFILTSISSGAANWADFSGGAGTFTSLTVTPGPITLTGTTDINTTGAATTTIGAGGTGAVIIGNTTGGVAIDGATTINVGGASDTSIGTTGTGIVSIGNTTGNTFVTGIMTVSGNMGTTNGTVTAGNTAASTSASNVQLLKSRTGGVITSGDALGNIIFAGNDGTGYITGAAIISTNSGTVATNRIAGNLLFYTHPDSTAAATLRVTIAPTGAITVATPDSGTAFTISGGGASVTGTTGINTTGAAVTTIGTGGTGAVNIGNATGNTAVTGSLTTTTSLTATLGNITATNGNVVLSTAAAQVILPGPIRIMSGAGAPANGLALEAGDMYIRTDPAGATSRIYVATAANTWTNVTCAA